MIVNLKPSGMFMLISGMIYSLIIIGLALSLPLVSSLLLIMLTCGHGYWFWCKHVRLLSKTAIHGIQYSETDHQWLLREKNSQIIAQLMAYSFISPIVNILIFKPINKHYQTRALFLFNDSAVTTDLKKIKRILYWENKSYS